LRVVFPKTRKSAVAEYALADQEITADVPGSRDRSYCWRHYDEGPLVKPAGFLHGGPANGGGAGRSKGLAGFRPAW